MPFATYLAKLVPTSLQRTTWGKYISTLGQALDGSADGTYTGQGSAVPDWGLIQRAKFAVKARFPDNPVGATATPEDAVMAIGGERQLERGSSEALQAFATRVRQAWDAWQYAGTAYGVLLQLWALGYRNVHVAIVNGNSYTLQSATGDPAVDLVVGSLMPSSWWPSPGSSPARRWWTRFAVIFDAPLPAPSTGAPSDWTSAIPADSSNEAATIKRIIARWKPAYAVVDKIVILSSGWVFGWPTTAKWGDAGLAKFGASVVTYWTP